MKTEILNPEQFTQNGWKEQALKVITHDGIFHADELFSIALLMQFERKEEVQIVRGRDAEFLARYRDFSDVYIIDIGNEYNPELGNFDHHQDENYVADKASIGLVYDYLMQQGKIEHELGLHLWDNLLMLINRWDLGLEQESANYYHRPLPSLISSYNRATEDSTTEFAQFEKALRFAGECIENETASFYQLKEARRGLLRSRHINSFTLLLDDFNPKYQNLMKQQRGIRFYIYPYKGDWAVAAVNAKSHPLPPCTDCTHLVFRHKNHFLAVFDDKEAAIRFLEPKFMGKI
jgi:uncharacterized UPF0160 family protein